MDEKTREDLRQRRLSERDTIETYMKMGAILEEELGLKMVGFDPGFSMRDEHWGSYQIPLDLAAILIRRFIELRVTKEVLQSVLDKAYPRPEIPDLINSIEEQVSAKLKALRSP